MRANPTRIARRIIWQSIAARRVAKRMTKRIIGQPIVGRSILLYHRVANADFDPFNVAIPPDEFERQLIRLRTKTVLPVREFTALHIQNKLPRNAIAITFDDGYACNALVAAPMLESFELPATFFIVSDAIARPEEFWWDELEFIVRAREFDFEAARRLLASHSITVGDTAREGGVRSVYLALWRALRDLPAEPRRQYFHNLRNEIGLKSRVRPTHRPMTAAELRTLAAKPLFEIGGHTATHPSLPTLDAREQEQEIVLGARFLEELSGKPIRSFSYPFGDWGPITREIVMRAGFECALTAAHRTVTSGDNRFEMPRRWPWVKS